MRESIEKFAEAMEKKLQQHDQDRGKLGWIVDPSCTLEYLLGRGGGVTWLINLNHSREK